MMNELEAIALRLEAIAIRFLLLLDVHTKVLPLRTTESHRSFSCRKHQASPSAARRPAPSQSAPLEAAQPCRRRCFFTRKGQPLEITSRRLVAVGRAKSSHKLFISCWQTPHPKPCELSRKTRSLYLLTSAETTRQF